MAADEEKEPDPSEAPRLHLTLVCAPCQPYSVGRPHLCLHNLFSLTDRRCLQASAGQRGSGRQNQNQFPATVTAAATATAATGVKR